jgi:type IX secretion system PorP/SprF family membrane protein
MRGSVLWLVLFCFCILQPENSFAQDAQFSQFYAAPSYLNPAFTGVTAQHRAVLNYRHQWPTIPGAFTSYNFAYDYNADALKSGIGIAVTRDNAGSGALRYTNIAGSYAYQININNTFFINPGVQVGMTTRDLDIDRLVFGNQMQNGGLQGAPNATYYNYQKTKYYDINSGVLAYNKLFWAGFAVHHLNEPNQSLLGVESRLPRKYSLHGGYRFRLYNIYSTKWDKSVLAAFNYKAQDKFDQLDLGMYYEQSPMIVGVWYRGIPMLKGYQPGYQNNDALTVLVGVILEKFRIGYSFDSTISKLVYRTGGSHEISLVYEIANKKRRVKQNKKRVPCAKF